MDELLDVLKPFCHIGARNGQARCDVAEVCRQMEELDPCFHSRKIVKAIHALMEEEGAVQLLQTKLDEAVERETDGGCSGTTVEAVSSGAIASAVHAVMESSLMQRVVEKTRRVVSVPNPPQSIDASLSLQDEEHRVATQPQQSQLQPKRRVSSGAGEPLQWEALEPGTEVLVLDDGESQGSDQRFDVRAALWRIAGASEPDENRESRGRGRPDFCETESMSSSGSTEPTPSNSRTPPAAGAASRVSPEELFVALGRLSMADVLSFEHWKRIVNVLIAQLTSARHNDALTYLARMFSSASGEQSVFMYTAIAEHVAQLPSEALAIPSEVILLRCLQEELRNHWAAFDDAFYLSVLNATVRVVLAHPGAVSRVDPKALWAKEWSLNFHAKRSLSAPCVELLFRSSDEDVLCYPHIASCRMQFAPQRCISLMVHLLCCSQSGAGAVLASRGTLKPVACSSFCTLLRGQVKPVSRGEPLQLFEAVLSVFHWAVSGSLSSSDLRLVALVAECFMANQLLDTCLPAGCLLVEGGEDVGLTTDSTKSVDMLLYRIGELIAASSTEISVGYWKYLAQTSSPALLAKIVRSFNYRSGKPVAAHPFPPDRPCKPQSSNPAKHRRSSTASTASSLPSYDEPPTCTAARQSFLHPSVLFEMAASSWKARQSFAGEPPLRTVVVQEAVRRFALLEAPPTLTVPPLRGSALHGSIALLSRDPFFWDSLFTTTKAHLAATWLRTLGAVQMAMPTGVALLHCSERYAPRKTTLLLRLQKADEPEWRTLASSAFCCVSVPCSSRHCQPCCMKCAARWNSIAVDQESTTICCAHWGTLFWCAAAQRQPLL